MKNGSIDLCFISVRNIPPNISCFPRRLQDVFKTSSRRLPRRLQNVFKTSSRRVCKKSCNYVFKTSSRRLQDVFSTSSPRRMFAGIRVNSEKEVSNTLPFLDVLFIRNWDHIHTTVFRKETNNDLYLYWNAFTSISWKREILRTLVNRACIICSDKHSLQQELKHIQRAFHIQNCYPMGVIKPVSKKVKQNKMILANTQIDAPLQTTNNVRTYVAVCWSLR